MKIVPGIDWETKLGYPARALSGVDEVGRGCLAGAVVAGAVVLPSVIDYEAEPWLREVTDSKLIKPADRERLSPLIQGWVKAWAVAEASVAEIDRINIFHASHLAMIRALEGLSVAPDHVLVDGKFLPKADPRRFPMTAVIKGDQKCLSIACASIIAKVHRDRQMQELDGEFPGYGFGVHKGYATPQHRAAISAQGPCAIHRLSFAPFKDAGASPA